MTILVIDDLTNEEIFYGEADDFLETNDYDTEIEEALNELERMNFNSKIKIYGNFEDTFTIVKEKDEDLY